MNDYLLKRDFEKQLLSKLQQKSKPSIGLDGYLINCFKFYDLSNKGTVTQDNFIKALLKVGITLDLNDLAKLYSMYNQNQAEINYIKFSNQILNINKGAANESSSSQLSKQEYNIDQVTKKLRQMVLLKGAKAFLLLIKSFKNQDPLNKSKVTMPQFIHAFNDLKINFDIGEYQKLFNYLDASHSGEVEYALFIKLLRGELNQIREKAVKETFELIDVERNQQISIGEIFNRYNPLMHPLVINGMQSEESIRNEFSETVSSYFLLNGNKSILSIDDFKDIYSYLSLGIDDDNLFLNVIKACWGPNKSGVQKNPNIISPIYKETILTFNPEQPKKYSPPEDSKMKPSPIKYESNYKPQNFFLKLPKNIPKFQGIVVERVKSSLISSNFKFLLNLFRQFKICDDSGTGIIPMNDFQKTIYDLKPSIDKRDLEALIKILDNSASGKINYIEFLGMIIGQLSEFRFNIINNAFSILDPDGFNTILSEKLKSSYNAAGHPDVKSGIAKEDDILKEFLESFELFHSAAFQFQPENVVSRQEFIDFYSILSPSIPNDSKFNNILTNTWNLQLGHGAGAQPFAGVQKKVFETNSKQQWLYDHHKSMLDQNHPLSHSNDLVNNVQPNSPPKNIQSKIASSEPPKMQSGMIPEISDQSVFQSISELKGKIIETGIKGLFSFIKCLRQYDQANTKEFSYETLEKSLITLNMKFAVDKLKSIYKEMERSGNPNTKILLHILFGAINPSRLALIHQSYEKLNYLKKISIEIDYIKNCYDPSKDPLPKSGKMREDQAMSLFLDSIDIFASLNVFLIRNRSRQ